MKRAFLSTTLFIVVAFLAACTSTGQTSQASEKLQVVATTTFVGDTVAKIAGDMVDLTVLLNPGENPHSYTPRPLDITRVADADIVFANGAGLEGFLDELLASAGDGAQIVYVSDGMDFLTPYASGSEDDHEHEGEDHDPEHEGEEHPDDHDENGEAHEDEHSHGNIDPHVWFDPHSIIQWTENIEASLAALDPENAETYQVNAAAYRDELKDLDLWILGQVETIPAMDRKLVTDHTSFGYFANAYDFEQIGAVIPAYTTEAESSGQDLAALEDTIHAQNVKAIFVSLDLDPSLSERVAEDTGVQLVGLYFGSLSDADGPAASYSDFMRYNVSTIVEALK